MNWLASFFLAERLPSVFVAWSVLFVINASSTVLRWDESLWWLYLLGTFGSGCCALASRPPR